MAGSRTVPLRTSAPAAGPRSRRPGPLPRGYPLFRAAIDLRGRQRILYAGNHYFSNLGTGQDGNSSVLCHRLRRGVVMEPPPFRNRRGAGIHLALYHAPPSWPIPGWRPRTWPAPRSVFASTYAFSRWLERPAWRQTLFLGASAALAALSRFSSLVFLPACMFGRPAAVLVHRAPAASGLPPRGSSQDRLADRRGGGSFADDLGRLSFFGGPCDGGEPALSEPSIDSCPNPTCPPTNSSTASAKSSIHSTRAPAFPSLSANYSSVGWWSSFPWLSPSSAHRVSLLYYIGLLRWRSNHRKVAGRTGCLQHALPCSAGMHVQQDRSGVGASCRSIRPCWRWLRAWDWFGLFPASAASQGRAVSALVLALWLVAACRPTPIIWRTSMDRLAANPEWVLAGSDLDWGQDLQRLSDKLKQLGVKQVSLAYFGTADLTAHGLPAVRPLPDTSAPPGWVAVSLHVTTIKAAAMQKASGAQPRHPYPGCRGDTGHPGRQVDRFYYVK